MVHSFGLTTVILTSALPTSYQPVHYINLPDPNWLLATIAQSSAAIVAIIGGFLVSKVLGLSAERNSIKRHLEDLQTELDHKRKSLCDAILANIQERAETLLLDRSMDALIINKGNISLDNLIDKYGDEGLSREELHYLYEIVVQEIKSAYQFFTVKNHISQSDPNVMDKFLEKYNLTLPEHCLNHVYDKVYGYLWLQAQPPKQPSSGLSDIILRTTNVWDLKAWELKQKERNTLNQKIQDLDYDVHSLLDQIRNYKDRHRILSHPEGVWVGAIVLAGFSLFGIAIPVCLMPVANLEPCPRVLLIMGFLIGLISVLGYIAFSIRELMK